MDSYVVDKELFENAMKKLKEKKMDYGLGVHSKGSCEWDGENESFSQLVISESDSEIISNKDFGIFEDATQFYNQNTSMKMSGVFGYIFPVILWFSDCSNSINKVRNEKNL